MGNDPLRTSRVNLIHLENAAFDSVVFQQGKSLLDFDLNVSQDVIKSMVEQTARSIFDKSGFLKPLNITTSGGSISIDPFTVNLFGKISRLVGTGTNDKIGITFANTTYPKFIWLEMWYQEITPLDTVESVDETLAQSLSPGSNKLKTSRIIKYGGIPNASLSQNLENNLKDINFGAETTRRVQFRWNIRATTSLSQVDSMASSSVFAVGGRTLDISWVESPTAINVVGTNGEPYNFVRSDEYVSSANTSYIDSLKNSLQEFALFNDDNVYIAGRGTSDDAKTLNTIDGRVYAIPLGVILGDYSFSKSSQATTPIGISTSGGSSSANVTIGSQGFLSFSNPAANISSGLLGTTPYITMDNISLKAGSLTAPAISYNDGSTIYQTGLYFSPAAVGTSQGITFGISGAEKFTIRSSLATLGTNSTTNPVGLTINGALTVNNSAVTLPGVSITSSGAATINNLSSNNISITGGSITAGLSSSTQITGSIDAYAKFSASINNEASGKDVRKIIFNAGSFAAIQEESYDSSSKTLTLRFSGNNAFAAATSGTTIVYNQASLPGEIWQEGVLDTPARRDHRHARESFPSSSMTIAQKSSGILSSDSSIKGTSNNTVSRGDHTHQLPSYFGPTLISTDGTNYSSISSSATSLEIYGSATTVNAGSPTAQLVVKDSSSTGNPSIGFFAQNSRWGGLYASKTTNGTASLFTLYGNASTSSNTLTTYATFDSTKADFPFGTSSKYFSANSGFGGGTNASRFIGAVSTKPTSSTDVNVGDFVIDTTGNIHIYGTKDSTNTWLTAGILTTANNSWTGVQNFGADISLYSTLASSSNYSYGINIGKDGGTGYTIATPVSGTSGKFSAFYIGNAQISGTGTLADSYSIDLGGVPLRTSTAATVTNFGGMIIRQAATSVAAGGSGYGLRVYTPKGGDNSYGIKIEGPEVSGTNSYGLHVSASSGATNNYALYVSGLSLFTSNVGIGTSSPTATLHTYGAVRFSQPTGGAAGGSPFDFTQYNDDLYLKMYRPANATQHSVYYMQMGIAGLDGGALTFRRSTAVATIGSEIMTDVLTMRSNGNVGIGTTSPSSALDIVGQDAARFSGYQAFTTWRDTGDANKGFRIQTVGGNTLFAVDATGGGAYVERIRINYLGNLGIGTSSPANMLHVAGETAQFPTSIYIAPTGHATSDRAGIAIDNWEWMQDTGGNGTKDFALYQRSTNTTRLNISTSGNVSVGGVATTATFNVTGTVSGAVAPKMFIPAQGFNLPITASPAFYQNNSGSVKYELQYSGTQIQVAYTMVVVPSSYSSGPITFKLQWYTATENQKVAWNILVASSGDGENPNPNLTLLKQINSTSNSAANMKYETFVWNSSVTELPLSGVSSGKMLYIGIQRNATDATNDTSTETVNFRSLIVEF